MRGFVAIIVVLLLSNPTELEGQETLEDSEFPSEPSLAWPIVGGAGMGLAGWVAGGFVGVAAASDCYDEFCGLQAFIYGAAAGGTVGLALGTHLGNRNRGLFPANVAAGAAVWLASLGLFHALGHDLGNEAAAAVWVIEPVAQFVTTLAVERAVGRARERRYAPRLSIRPRRNGLLVGVELVI